MKKVIFAVIIVVSLAMYSSFSVGCKKFIEDQKEKAIDSIMRAIVDGTWYVTKYTASSKDSTSLFSGWEFKFYNDKTSIATKNGTTDTLRGTWNGNIDTYIFSATFNTTPPPPLDRIAGNWTVTTVPSASKGNFARYVNLVVTNELQLTKK